MPFESGANLVNWVCNFRLCLVVGQLKRLNFWHLGFEWERDERG